MKPSSSLALSAAVLPLLAAPALALTLTNGTGDGNVSVEASEFGFLFGAVFDPVGEISAGNVVFQSYVAADRGGDIVDLDSELTESDFELVRQSASEAVTRFDLGDLRVTLTQTLADTSEGDQRVGSALTQQFAIENLSAEAARFDLYRYLDGELFLTDTPVGDGGGVIERDGRTILYQSDVPGAPGPDNVFLGIDAEGGTAPEQDRYRVSDDFFVNAPLGNEVQGDTDGDGIVDQAFDVKLTLRNEFAIAAGGSATYITSTMFGTGVPMTPVTPTPDPETPAPIPLPASALMLLGGLGALGATGRRRRG